MLRIGDIVELKADQQRKGAIIAILPPVNGRLRFKVFHAPDDTKEYLEDQVSLVDLVTSIEVPVIPLAEFFVRLNALRLASPQVDSLYALHASRIRYIPFQFKPLMRFLRAERPRLLVADEVGVGKTIEAGLILRELQSRQELRSVLIVCPKALVTKWHAEMRRFDEDFKILTAETLRYCIKETHQDGVWPVHYQRSIGHIELLRRDEYLRGHKEKRNRIGLTTLSPPPQFDLLIVDEAHHLRTPESNTYELAEFLCDVSVNVIFLTATPMQVGSRNLFSLLKLLRPDQFDDEGLFSEMVEPNRYLNKAIRHVRTKKPSDTWHQVAMDALENASRTTWGSKVLVHDPRFADWQCGLSAGMGDEQRVRFVRDMEDVHTLSHVMNRTRRRDIGQFTIREPHTVSVPFTDDQRELYQALIEFRKAILSLHYDPIVVRLIIDTLERQAASCLPALLPNVRGFIQSGKLSYKRLTDDPDYEDIALDMPSNVVVMAEKLEEMIDSLPSADPKSDQLLILAKETMSTGGGRKILVFSFFLHTLHYLEKRFQDAGFRVGVVSGQIDDEQREELRSRFRRDSSQEAALDILLSSEVGCEGLDYEFCDRLVNYDIPWNPMRIEQRIGRIDRFGQKNPKIQIYNFITPGTIEERVFFRCFERLGLFRDTVGDMEEVLGELTQGLTQAVLDPTLSDEQTEQKARQLEDNALREAEELRRLELESAEVLGLDRAFQDEVERIEGQKKFVSPKDLYHLITLYFDKRCATARIVPDKKQDTLVRLRAYRDDKDVLLEDLKRLKRIDKQATEFGRWLESGEGSLEMTFDQATALDQRQLAFVTPVHPLTKMAVAYWRSTDVRLFTQTCVQDLTKMPGIYVFAYFLWETISFRSDVRLVAAVWDVKNERPDTEMANRIDDLMRGSDPSDSNLMINQEKLDEALYRLDEDIHRQREIQLEQVRTRNDELIRQRLASLQRYYERRLSRVAEELSTASEERIKIMKAAERERVLREWENRKQDLERRQLADIVSQRVAWGVIDVKGVGDAV